MGDSLRQKIDQGLSQSRFGVVIISPSFLKKEWTAKELDSLLSRESKYNKAILPIWHECDENFIRENFPLLHGKYAGNTQSGVNIIAKQIKSVVLNSPLLTRHIPDYIEITTTEEGAYIQLTYGLRAKKSDILNLTDKKELSSKLWEPAGKILEVLLGDCRIYATSKALWDTTFYANEPDANGLSTGVITARRSVILDSDYPRINISFMCDLEDDWGNSHSLSFDNTFKLIMTSNGLVDDEDLFRESYTVDRLHEIYSAMSPYLANIISIITDQTEFSIFIGKSKYEEDAYPFYGSDAYSCTAVVVDKLS